MICKLSNIFISLHTEPQKGSLGNILGNGGHTAHVPPLSIRKAEGLS